MHRFTPQWCKHRDFLSITRKLNSDHNSELDVGQSSRSSRPVETKKAISDEIPCRRIAHGKSKECPAEHLIVEPAGSYCYKIVYIGIIDEIKKSVS